MPNLHEPPAPRLVVGVGASAGGLKALEVFFSAIAPDSGCAYLVVQHLSPDFKSVMDELLARHTRVPIRVATAGTAPEANTIYLVPPKMQVAVRDRRFVLTDRKMGQGVELPINLLFASLAREYGPTAVGVVLSGTGSDGTEGLRAIHADGGLVIVQSPDTAEFDGMPRNALALGIADYMLPPQRMAEAIAAYDLNPNLRLEPAPNQSGADETQAGEFAPIFNRLQQTCGIDFKPYKIATIERRIRRRMEINHVADVPAYTALLTTLSGEADQLYHDLLIGVTEFFRDPKAFEVLQEEVLRPLFRDGAREEVRVWSAACASGEEAYSLAMMMDELAREYDFKGRWSIFATDVHRSTLAHAGQGLFQAEHVARLTPARRDRYFTKEETGQWRVIAPLRQRIVFAAHNILADPPFTKLDLITCRNLLIYFRPAAQERAIGLFHYGLRGDGALLLGMSEGLGRLESEFETLDGKLKLYRKAGEGRLPLDLVAPGMASRALRAVGPTAVASSLNISRLLLQGYDELLAVHAPPGFIVSEAGELLHTFGNAGSYLLPETGRTETILIRRCEGDLRVAVVTLLAGAFKSNRPVVARGIAVDGSDGPEVVDMTAKVIARSRPGTSLAFIGVQTRRVAEAVATAGTGPATELVVGDTLRQRIGALELEIQSNRENLQTTVEELQTTNEELQASNEEMVASNEELQATNEELHSVNEELHTVNAELETRNGQLRALNDDLDNLFVSLEVGVLFIDRDLRIRKFNSAVQKIFKLLPQDVGRPLDHISYQLGAQEELLAEVRAAIDRGEACERERRTREGAWLLKRIVPFFSAHRAIEGAVLTFTDISEIKRLQSRVELAIEASRLVWWDWDLPTGRLTTHTSGPCILGYDHTAIMPSADTWFNATHPDDLPAVRASMDACLRGETAVWDCEHRFRSKAGSWVWVAQRGRVTERDSLGKPQRMLGTTQDVNARRLAEESMVRDAGVLARLQEAVVCTDETGRVDYWGARAVEIFALDADEAIGRVLADVFPAEAREPLEAALAELVAGTARQIEWAGPAGWFETQLSRYTGPNGRPGVIALSRDVSDRRRETMRLRETERQLVQSQKMETLGTLAGGIAHDFNNLLTAILGSAELAAGELTADHPCAEHIGNVRLAGRRATELVRQILAFSRTGSQAREPLAAGPFLKQLLPTLRASIPASINIKLAVAAGSLSIQADRSQLQQVIFNLCTNAAHAMSKQGGVLSLGLDRVILEAPTSCLVGDLPAGRFVRFSVADEGPGIPEEFLARILEPFFTTKAPGEGTGLGLSIVHGVITAHQGGLRLINRPGDGATFEVLLPEVVSVERAALPEPTKVPVGQDQCIAVVDDETIVAEICRKLLLKHNYRPLVFKNAAELLQHVGLAGAEPPALIITDQTMPQLTGIEMIRILRQRGISTPIILMSGYTHGVSPDEAKQIERVAFVPKPFEHAHLLEVVQQMLQMG